LKAKEYFLRASNLKFSNSHLEILIESSKTDIYRLGHTVVIAKTNSCDVWKIFTKSWYCTWLRWFYINLEILNFCKLSIGYCFRKIVFNISEVIGSFFWTGFDNIWTLPSRIIFINCSEKIEVKRLRSCSHLDLKIITGTIWNS
jgi:hypothetical protein